MNDCLYVYDVSAYMKILSKKWYKKRLLERKYIKDGFILPSDHSQGILSNGGVLNSDREFVTGLTHDIDEVTGKPISGFIKGYEFSIKDVKFFNEDVIYGGVISAHFGHFILQCMTRLWYVIEHPEIKLRIAFIITHDGGKYKSWFDDFFHLLGINKNRILIVNEPSQFSGIIVPDESAYTSHSYTDEYLVPFKKIVQTVSQINNFIAYEKIYLSHRHTNLASKFLGEDYFEHWFTKNGYKVIFPEELSLCEQIFVVSHAKKIACVCGTLSHWALFTKKDTEFIILTRVNWPLAAQCFVNIVTGIKYFFIDTSMNFLPTASSFGSSLLIGPTEKWQKFIQDNVDKNYNSDMDREKVIRENIYSYLTSFIKYNYPNPKIDLNKFNGIQLMNNLRNIFPQRQMPPMLQSQIYEYNQIFAKEDKRDTLYYTTHMSGWGWLVESNENEINGAPNSGHNIEAIQIQHKDIAYSVYDKIHGWSDYVTSHNYENNLENYAGTIGESIPIYGVHIYCKSDDKSVMYRCHFKNENKFTEWTKENVKVFSDTPLDAIIIKLMSHVKNKKIYAVNTFKDNKIVMHNFPIIHNNISTDDINWFSFNGNEIFNKKNDLPDISNPNSISHNISVLFKPIITDFTKQLSKAKANNYKIYYYMPNISDDELINVNKIIEKFIAASTKNYMILLMCMTAAIIEKYKEDLINFIEECKKKYSANPQILVRVSDGIPCDILQNCDYVISDGKIEDVVAGDYAINFGAETVDVNSESLFTMDKLIDVHGGGTVQ